MRGYDTKFLPSLWPVVKSQWESVFYNYNLEQKLLSYRFTVTYYWQFHIYLIYFSNKFALFKIYNNDVYNIFCWNLYKELLLLLRALILYNNSLLCIVYIKHILLTFLIFKISMWGRGAEAQSVTAKSTIKKSWVR